MNRKNIARSCKAKMDDWLKTIDDIEVEAVIRKNAMITGGAIVSLLTGERPHDYDIYFKTLESCEIVSQYYVNQWNKTHDKQVTLTVENGRVILTIGAGRGDGVVVDADESAIDDDTEPYTSENEEDPTKPNPEVTKPKYRPRYFTTNAISLSDDIQIVIRFTGQIDEIHQNYDFEHCKCSYDYKTNDVNLPNHALECIINKELFYSGSKYPLCSIIRTRKFIARGWTINAGQYVKMALQLNELDLKDIKVFKEQLVGVDSAYFSAVIDYLEKRTTEDKSFQPDNAYLFEVINRIF